MLTVVSIHTVSMEVTCYTAYSSDFGPMKLFTTYIHRTSAQLAVEKGVLKFWKSLKPQTCSEASNMYVHEVSFFFLREVQRQWATT